MTDATDSATSAARAAGKNIGSGARQLGVVSLDADQAPPLDVDPALRERALGLLREEVERMGQARAVHAAEQAQGAPSRSSARLDAMAASLEGATRFALRCGLVTPGDAREIWTAARAAGVHDRPTTPTEGS